MKGQEILDNIRKSFVESAFPENMGVEGGMMEDDTIILFDTSWMDKKKLLNALEKNFKEKS